MIQAKQEPSNIVQIDFNKEEKVSKKVRVARGKKLRLPKLLMVCGVLFLLYSFGGQYLKMHRLQQEITRLDAEMNNFKAQNGKLEKELKRMETDIYVERMAREKLGLIKAGEIPIMEAKIVDGNVIQKDLKNDEQNIH